MVDERRASYGPDEFAGAFSASVSVLIHLRADAVVPTLSYVHGLSKREAYLFDVQGWLVIPRIVRSSLLQALNDALDANQDRFGEEDEDLVEESKTLAGEHRRRRCSGMLEWPHPHCEPFRELIAYSPLIGYLDGFLGRGWHLDHPPEVFDYPRGTEGHVLHFGEPFPQDGVCTPPTQRAISASR